jgi:hypothetical protein
MDFISRIFGRKKPAPKPDVIVHTSIKPQDLDDPFVDEAAQKRIGAVISNTTPKANRDPQ